MAEQQSTEPKGVEGGVIEYAREITQKLEVLWEEVGYSKKARTRQLQQLLIDVRHTLDRKLKEEEGVRDQFITSVGEQRGLARKLLQSLGIDPDDGEMGDGGGEDLNLQLLGEGPGDETADNKYNLTEYLALLEVLVEDIRAKVDAQKARFQAVLEPIERDCHLLGEEVPERLLDLDNNLEEDRLEVFEAKRRELEQAVDDRVHTMVDMIEHCEELYVTLQEPVEDALDTQIRSSLLPPQQPGAAAGGEGGGEGGGGGARQMSSLERSDTCVGISRQALAQVSERLTFLTEEKERRRVKLETMGEEILVLWQLLDVPQEEQLSFTNGVNGLGTETMEAGEKEVTRLRVLKSQRMGELVLRAREKISSLWEALHMPEGDPGRDHFKEFKLQDGENGCIFDDALLSLHEEEAQRLQRMHESLKGIIDKLNERAELLEKRAAYEEGETVVQGRGAEQAKMLRQKLKEETLIKKRLPWLNEKLRRGCAAWEEKHGEAFMWNGRRYLDQLEEEETEWAELQGGRKREKEAKKQGEKDAAKREALAARPGAGNVVGLARGGNNSSFTRKGSNNTLKGGNSGNGTTGSSGSRRIASPL